MPTQIWNFPNSKIAMTDPPIAAGKPMPAWQEWFQQATSLLSGLTRSGPSVERPSVTNPTKRGLFVGRFYYDTDLHKPIWYDPDSSVLLGPNEWRDATGTFV